MSALESVSSVTEHRINVLLLVVSGVPCVYQGHLKAVPSFFAGWPHMQITSQGLFCLLAQTVSHCMLFRPYPPSPALADTAHKTETNFLPEPLVLSKRLLFFFSLSQSSVLPVMLLVQVSTAGHLEKGSNPLHLFLLTEKNKKKNKEIQEKLASGSACKERGFHQYLLMLFLASTKKMKKM